MTDESRSIEYLEVDPESGTAMRVLHSAVSSLDLHEPRMTYWDFASNIDEDVREAMELSDVLQFIRESLSVAHEEVLLIVPLVDEGNAAENSFGPEKTNPDGHQVTHAVLPGFVS